MGVIMAFFHSSGTAETEKSCLKTIERGSAKLFLRFLKRIGGRRSGPAVRLFF
jgi:hypothetical protein